MNAELKPGERLDDLQINGYHIIQHPEKFCFGMDASCYLPLPVVNRTVKLQISAPVPE